jgi:hypothetical protein
MSKNVLQQILKISPLVVIVAGLLSYNFMSAQWQAPTAAAPNDNTEAPINVSTNYQAKLGDLGAVRMRAGEYCNAAGTVCFNPTTVNQQRTCPTNQFVRGINTDGTLVCATATTTAPATCTTQSTTASSCCYGSCSPSCPAGYTRSGPSYRGSSCSTNNDTWTTPCIRTVCS